MCVYVCGVMCELQQMQINMCMRSHTCVKGRQLENEMQRECMYLYVCAVLSMCMFGSSPLRSTVSLLPCPLMLIFHQ